METHKIARSFPLKAQLDLAAQYFTSTFTQNPQPVVRETQPKFQERSAAMGLLVRILQRLYRLGAGIIQASLIDAPYSENQMLVGIANLFIIIALVGGFGSALYAFIWAISLEIFVKALLLAYLLAWVWSKFGQQFTSFEQEMYLMGSTVSYTVLIGAAIQIQRMPWVDSKLLFVYWTFLLILGFILWSITLSKTTGLTKNNSRVLINQLKYKKRFHQTRIAKEVTSIEQFQAYLKRMK